MEIVYYLSTVTTKSAIDNGRRVTSVLIILDLLNKISGDLQRSELPNVSEINVLFSMLMLKPATKFHDLRVAVNSIPKNYRKHVADVLAQFINEILPSNHLEQSSWVYVVPLIHALDDNGSAGDIKWSDSRITMQNIGKTGTNAFLK
jgi:hypothetical protein